MQGATPLHLACSRFSVNAVRVLLQGRRINTLVKARTDPQVRTVCSDVRLLIDMKDVLLHGLVHQGWTALHFAACSRSGASMVADLLEAGALSFVRTKVCKWPLGAFLG
jgi:hypothetical protein